MSVTTADDCEFFETPPTTETRIDVSSDLVIVVRYLLQETVELYRIEPIRMVILIERMEQRTCAPIVVLTVPSEAREDHGF